MCLVQKMSLLEKNNILRCVEKVFSETIVRILNINNDTFLTFRRKFVFSLPTKKNKVNFKTKERFFRKWDLDAVLENWIKYEEGMCVIFHLDKMDNYMWKFLHLISISMICRKSIYIFIPVEIRKKTWYSRFLFLFN